MSSDVTSRDTGPGDAGPGDAGPGDAGPSGIGPDGIGPSGIGSSGVASGDVAAPVHAGDAAVSGDAGPLPAWIAAIRAVSRALGVLAAGLIVLSIGVICQMVFVRSVLGQSSIWQTEFVTFAIIAATFLGAPYILLTKGHVAVDIVPLLLGQRARRALHLVGMLIALAFCGFFLWSALPWWLDAFRSGQTAPSIWQPRLWIPYTAVPIGLGVLCLELVAEIYLVASGRELPFGLAVENAP